MKKRLFITLALIATTAAGFTACTKEESTVKAQEQQNGASVTATEYVQSTAQALIGNEAALNKALEHAQLEKANVTLTKNVLDDDGAYEIEFSSASKEYDYEINAKTGAVVSCDIEIIRTAPASTTVQTTNAAQSAFIGTDAALDAALKHAGVNKSDATVIKNKLDGGKYEIEFVCNGKEYDYEINAKSGSVIGCEIELAHVTSTIPQGEFIGESRALSAALSHAGLNGSQVTSIKTELDYDRLTPKYEIEFRFNGYEYDYEINALTGAVIKGEKEADID